MCACVCVCVRACERAVLASSVCNCTGHAHLDEVWPLRQGQTRGGRGKEEESKGEVKGGRAWKKCVCVREGGECVTLCGFSSSVRTPRTGGESEGDS